MIACPRAVFHQAALGAAVVASQSLPGWCSTPLMFCSVTFGCVPDLAPRDRGLVTVGALIASGQIAQIT